MDKLLLKNLANATIKRSPEMDGDACPGEKVKMFSVDGDKSICKIWNSSNDSSFDKKEACREILNKLLDHSVEGCYMEGNFSIGFNEIWFEMKEK